MTTTAMLLSMTLAMTAAAPSGAPVMVDVQAKDAAGRNDTTLEEQLEGKLREALTREGVKVDATATGRRVIVDVRKVDVIDYQVDVRVEVDGVLREPGVEGFSCESCRVVELYDRVLERVPEMVAAVAVEEEPGPAAVAEPESVADPDPEPEDAGTPSESPDEDRVGGSYRRLGAVGYTGIAAAGVAVVVAAAGVPILLEQPMHRLRPGDDAVRETVDRVPLGAGLIGLSGGLLVTGLVLVVVDQTVLRKKRAEKARRAAFVPSFTPGGVRLGFSARF